MVSNTQWAAMTEGASAIYGEGDTYCQSYSSVDGCDEDWSLEQYGRLYNWFAVNDNRSLCPAGWHVPSDNEWEQLFEHLGGDSVAGGSMKAQEDWYNASGGDNSSGFSALPGGFRSVAGSNGITGGGGFYYHLSDGFWWSSSQATDSSAWFTQINWASDVVYHSTPKDKRRGYSIRCIKDFE